MYGWPKCVKHSDSVWYTHGISNATGVYTAIDYTNGTAYGKNKTWNWSWQYHYELIHIILNHQTFYTALYITVFMYEYQ